MQLEFQKFELFEKINFKFVVLFFMELELHKKFSMELEFVKLELHNNLEFHKLEFRKQL